MNQHHTARGFAITTVAVLLVASGCSSADTVPTPATSPVATSSAPGVPSPSVLPVDAVKQKAIAAYLGMWSDMADAATTSDWQSPKLAQNATAEALLTISRGLYTDHSNGLVAKGRPANRPTVTTVDPQDNPTTVTIDDCGDSTHWLKYRADNGQLADDSPGGHRHIEALVKLAVDGTWKVTNFAVHELGSCAG